jgi:N4-(beta-N-acetylglucosaminyl)-L-asparaginase
MFNRRHFLSYLSFIPFLACGKQSDNQSITDKSDDKDHSIILTTWNNAKANQIAYEELKDSSTLLNAIEKGIRVVEADPNDHSVGYGGLPDRSGHVTLDACIMDHEGNAGSVCYVQNYKHPISIARKVMTETPHVIMSGKGAEQFAENQGFKKENLLTEYAKEKWETWLKTSKYQPIINIENHDTIGMLARSKDGQLSGGCSTSGLAYKMEGRVGDSPIIGAGLFVDGQVGTCVATGLGEEVLKNLSSFLVVELMRQGKSPYEACKQAILRITEKTDYTQFQVGLIALSNTGQIGAYSIQPGFIYTQTINGQTSVNESDSYVEKS